MTRPAVSACSFACSAALVLCIQAGAHAQTISGVLRAKAQAETAIRLDDGDASLARINVLPRYLLRGTAGWRGEVSGRLVAASDGTGLGTTETFSSASRPLDIGPHGRIELDRAFITLGTGDHRLTLGKQSLAWGILDGLQVTDRFDPINRTEAVFGEVRPQRLARWGARWQGQLAGLEFDAAAAFDPTVNQLPLAGAAFAPRAPRLRAGFPEGAQTPPVTISTRDRYISDATYGLRISRPLGQSEASLVLISGPETEPVFAAVLTPSGPVVELRYPRRTLIGATFERSDGPRVWRLEAAYTPGQPVNVLAAPFIAAADRPRYLGGLGLDWSAPNNVFVNLQIGVDHIDAGGMTLVRPQTDVIATLRLQRAFHNERLWLKSELLGSLSEGDGAIRPWMEWRQSDNVLFSVGADLVWGHSHGLFGQYAEQSRLWMRVNTNF
ncbi:DUF1302 family protein [Glycocaulis sp.]